METTLITLIEKIGVPGGLLLGLLWVLKAPTAALGTALAESVRGLTSRIVTKLDQDEAGRVRHAEALEALNRSSDAKTAAMHEMGAAMERIGVRIDEAHREGGHERGELATGIGDVLIVAQAARDAAQAAHQAADRAADAGTRVLAHLEATRIVPAAAPHEKGDPA